MEIPRRRGGAYEHRSSAGNILAPTSTPQAAADLRTTPARGPAPSTASRPPWATELDSAVTTPTSARPPSASRQRTASSHTPPAGAQDFAFPSAAGPRDNGSGLWQQHPHQTPPRPPSGSGTRAPPVDQLDLWTQQQHHHHPPHAPSGSGRPGGDDDLYANVDHSDAVAGSGSAHAGRRGPTAVAAPPRSGGGAAGSRLQGGDLGGADVRSGAAARTGPGAAGGPPARGAATAAAAGGPGGPRVGASPARPRPGAVGAGRQGADAAAASPAGVAAAGGPARSTSTPKPRPAAPPKRSTSITDNVRRDWVDAGGQGDNRRGSGARGGGSAGNAGASRWDADPEGSDRGSWLFVADPPPPASPPGLQKQSRDDDASAPMIRGSGSGEGASGGGERPAPRRTRAEPHTTGVEGGFEATFSPTAVAAAAAPAPSLFGGAGSGDGGGGGGFSLGHGITAGPSAGGGGGAGGSRGGSRQQPTAAHAEAARQVQVLQDENARLRDQLEHLQRLLAASPGGAVGAEAGSGGVTRRAGGGARPSSAASAGGGADGAPPLAVAAAAGVTLQQYKSQVIQLQRQVALMSKEMEAKSRLGMEAEGVLLEVAARLGDLAAAASAISSSAASAAAHEGASGGSGTCGDGALGRDQLLQLHKWSKQMLGRLRSEKSQSSKLFTQQAQGLRTGGAGSGPGPPPSWSDSAGSASGTGPAPTWLVPFIPAGGNRFLLAGAAGGAGGAAADDLAGAAGGGGGITAAGGGPSVAAIACGQAALLADPLLAHRLELQLAALAPKLAAVAVLVKTQLLPAMPWLGLEAADRLQAEVGEAAEGVAQCADSLVSLCSLLPAGAAVFGDGPVAQEPARRAAEMDAGRDSWLYSSPGLTDAPEPPPPVCNDEGVLSVARLQAAITPLLKDRKAGGKALGDILEPLRAKAQSAASKRTALEAELRFAARASSLHAEHVSHLVMSVGMALEECRGAKDAAAIKSYFAAAAAVKQVLEAADALELHPCENCLKALVDVIRVHRDTLDRLPDLLLNAPAADVEGRLLSKVEELHQGFKKAISRLEAHKRRQHDARAGVIRADGSAEADAGADDGDADQYSSDYERDEEQDAAGAAAGTGSRERRQGGGASRQQRPVGQGQQQGGGGTVGASAGGVKSGKPPKPKPEWQG